MSIDGQNAAPVNLSVFLSAHSVFTVEEVRHYLAEHGSTNPKTRKALLTYHRSKGRVLPIRRGLYASVPPGRDPATYAVDPVLITAKLTTDAVLAYHTALEYHGKTYTTYNRMVYASDTRSPTALFRGTEYLRVPHPATLRSTGNTEFGISSSERDGGTIRVTNLERTLVDVLDRPDVSGSWEEIWRSLEMVEFFDLEQVIHYAEHLANATTAAKVGFYLSQHQDALMVDDEILAMLRRMVPKQPHYMDRGKRSDGRLVPEWNLLVPLEILERSWEEVL